VELYLHSPIRLHGVDRDKFPSLLFSLHRVSGWGGANLHIAKRLRKSQVSQRRIALQYHQQSSHGYDGSAQCVIITTNKIKDSHSGVCTCLVNPEFTKAFFVMKNATQFRSASVNVISYKPIKQGLPYVLTKLTNVQQHYSQITYTEFQQNSTVNVEGTHLRKEWLSMSRFTRHSQ
jgi:hypothetical protein